MNRAPGSAAPRQAGTTLLEILVVTALMGLLAVPLVARTGMAEEQMRVDRAGGLLRTIWLAQRGHYLERGAFASQLSELVALGLLPADLPAQQEPFRYVLGPAGDAEFAAQAVRQGSLSWSGTLTIDEWGVLGGGTSNGRGQHVAPMASD